MSNSKQFDRLRFVWLDQVLADSELPPSAFKVAYRLGQDFNERFDGEAWESCKKIGRAIGLSEATIIIMVRRLHERGHLRVEWGRPGRGHPNRYQMILTKPQSREVSETVKPQEPEVLGEQRKPQDHNRKPQDRVRKPQPAKETSLKTQLKTQRKSQIPPDDASLTQRKSLPREEENSDGFAEFWRVYPKHVGEDAARAAFAKAVKRGADPAAIVQAAKLYAVSECARIEREHTPQYTKHAGNWIKAGHWKDEAPPGVILDENGDVIAVEDGEDGEESEGDRVWRLYQEMAAASGQTW
jgi:hypothetical protein